MPYSRGNRAKALEAKRKSARKRRALAAPEDRETERQANRVRNQADRDARRPEPVTEADFLKDAARFGPAKEAPLDRSSLKGVSVGFWLNGKSRRISISETDEHPAAVATIGTLESIVLGKGYDYNPANTFGEPYWWRNDRHALEWEREVEPPYQFGAPAWWSDDPPNYRGEERRWALYSLSFRHRNWSQKQGRAAEARGIEIAVKLTHESGDVRRVATWLRDGWTRVPPRSARHITRQRVEAAMDRLKKLGILRQISKSFRIQ